MDVAIDWTGLGETATFAAVGGAAIMALIRARLGRDFPSYGAHQALAARVDAVERIQRDAPSQDDIRNIGERVQKVETGVAVVQTSVNGLSEGLKRVENMVDLLVQHQLGKESPAVNFQDVLAEDQRLVVLRALRDVDGGTMNESVVKTALPHFGHRVPSDLVRAHLEFLERHGLLRVERIDAEGGALWIAKLTGAGLDVAEGSAHHAGVAWRRPA